MSIFFQDGNLLVNGQPINSGMHPEEPLLRAVIISLFTWRRAQPGDVAQSENQHGWWGDNFPVVQGDQIGSRLWLLSREKITSSVIQRAKEYATEALQWLVDDGVALRVDIEVERQGIECLVINSTIYRQGKLPISLRFSDAWRNLSNAV